MQKSEHLGKSLLEFASFKSFSALSFGVRTISIKLNDSRTDLLLNHLTFENGNWSCNTEETILIEPIKADSAHILGNSIGLFRRSDNQTLVQVEKKILQFFSTGLFLLSGNAVNLWYFTRSYLTCLSQQYKRNMLRNLIRIFHYSQDQGKMESFNFPCSRFIAFLTVS